MELAEYLLIYAILMVVWMVCVEPRLEDSGAKWLAPKVAIIAGWGFFGVTFHLESEEVLYYCVVGLLLIAFLYLFYRAFIVSISYAKTMAEERLESENRHAVQMLEFQKRMEEEKTVSVTEIWTIDGQC